MTTLQTQAPAYSLESDPAFLALRAQMTSVMGENTTLKAQVSELLAERANTAKATLEAQATAFADRLIMTEKRYLPAARADLELAYLNAARQDQTSPPAAGAKGAVAALESLMGGLPPHALTVSMLPHAAFGQGGQLASLPPFAAKSAEDQQEETFRLLAQTPEGVAALQKTGKGKEWWAAHQHEYNGFALPTV